ncbi:phosphoribosyltransferase [Pseudanabaena mucicola]|uniref:Phosphoribosyltransferase n=1 Tax=Pseudanabaena mucicola FACHB-723 TaxID=2692860 RepID=A0ABR7ZXC8_9CYAN|nr:phosphoribosyltransferase family protein [Pseudanabaena mucicola]MBD2188482.1 phosphoribosyltransferase [Pseudanabaena mucicola FACHB-723]
MSDLYISWDEYHAKIELLAVQIYRSQWEFDQILCLARGGLRIGDTLSRIYNKPLAILSTSSYGGKDFQERGKLTIANNITMTTATLGKKILLVDDLVDSGVTLARILEWLKEHEEFAVTEVRSAVIWFKAVSIAKPDYYVDFLSDNPWIHQPFEKYEKMNLGEL